MSDEPTEFFKREATKHVSYLLKRWGDFLSGRIEPREIRVVLRDFCTNTAPLCDAPPPPTAPNAPLPQQSAQAPAFAYVGGGRCIVRLPFGILCFLGQNLDVSPGFWRDGVHEQWTTRLVRTLLHPGDTYFNIGANFGYYTVLGASLVGPEGRVISVEANPRIFDCAVRSVYYSGVIGRVRLHRIAVSDRSGETLRFSCNPVMSGGGSLVMHAQGVRGVEEWHEGDLSHPGYCGELGLLDYYQPPFVYFEVTTCTLDELWRSAGRPRVQLLHMDIEGAEFLALCGAAEMLAANPDIHVISEICAIDKGDTRKMAAFEQVVSRFEQTGHRAYAVVTRGEGTTLRPIDLRARIDSLVHGDYVFVPPRSPLQACVDSEPA